MPFLTYGTVNLFSGTLVFTRGVIQDAGSTVLAGGILDSAWYALNGGTLDLGDNGFVLATAGLNIAQGASLWGVGIVQGDLTNSGTINLGGSGEPLGLLTISGDFTQTSTGTLILRLQKAQNQQYDRLSVSSTATLAGTLQGVAQAGFNPVNLDEFAILTVQAGGSVVGNFNTPYTLPALGVGLSWSWVLGAGGLTLKVKQ